MSTSVSATNGSVAVGNIQVGGNVSGDIIIGHHNFKVNTNYGTIVYNEPRDPVIKRRDTNPQPPRKPLDFFDRTEEQAQVEQFITQGKPVAIYGPDGAGKSALLRQIANGHAARALPDGVILLEGLDEQGYTLLPEDVTQRWFDAFYLSEPPLKVTFANAQPYLSQLHPLVLLDHTPLDVDRLRPLLDLFPNSPALIARLSALPGLARPIKLGPLLHSDGIDLFAATSGLLIDETNRPNVDAICTLINDVPLAIVRIADLIREMNLSLDQALAQLSAAPPTEGDPITVGLSRAVTLVKSVLTLLEQQILGIAANLPGVSIDPDMIASLMGGDLQAGSGGKIIIEGEWVNVGGIRVRRRDGVTPEIPDADHPPAATPDAASIEMAIEHLKSLGLLHANSPRVRMDGGLRDLFRGLGNASAIKDRLLAQLLFDQLNGRFSDNAYCMNELGHVMGEIEYAVQTQQWNAAIVLSRAIDRYLTLNGLWDAWGQIANWVLQSARLVGDRSAEAWALHQLGTRAIRSDQAQAIYLLRQALSVRQSIGETTAAAYTQHNLDVLIPPPVPPKNGEGPIGPTGMSGEAKAVVGLVVVGLIALGAILLSRLSLRPAAPTSVAVVGLAKNPTYTTLPILLITSTETPLPTRVPTSTFTAIPTATQVPTPSVLPTPVHPSWPIVFFSGNDSGTGYEVFTINSDGLNRKQITQGLQEHIITTCVFPAGMATISPNEKQVAYIQFQYTATSHAILYLMNSDGTNLIPVVDQELASLPRWSPDSTMIAVHMYSNEVPSSIQIFDQNGKLLSTIGLTNSPGFQTGQVSWSPDSKQIAFNDGTNIFLTNVDGSNKIQITKNDQDYISEFPGWSPDGKWIAFIIGSEIHLIHSDGTPYKIFSVVGGDFAWSPDSTQLAFDGDNNLSIIDIDSGKVSILVDKLGVLLGPVWSPDAKQIAFTVVSPKDTTQPDYVIEGPGRLATSAIYLINADGSGLLNLTNTPGQNDFISYPHICAQCPYVFTYNPTQHAWQYDTTILYKLIGKNSETVQSRPLTQFDGRLLIREVEPETSYLDQIYVAVIDSSGREIDLRAQPADLREADNRYFIMHQGDELLLTFDGFDQIHSPQQVSVVAKGYYVPYQNNLVTAP